MAQYDSNSHRGPHILSYAFSLLLLAVNYKLSNNLAANETLGRLNYMSGDWTKMIKMNGKWWVNVFPMATKLNPTGR